jgi:hypothetical protein
VQKVLLLTTCLFMAAATTAAESPPDAGPDSSTRTLVWPDGTRYVGGVSDGKRDGKGTIFWQDGTRFVGHFTNDLRNGPGTMVLANGTVYTGYFTDDVLVENPLPAASGAENTNADVMQASSSIPTRPTEMAAPLADVSEQQLQAAQSIASTDPARVEASVEAPMEVLVAAAEPIAEPMTEQALEPVAEPDMTAPVESTTPLYQPVTQLDDAVRQALQASIDNWAAHWSKQDLPAYLNSYSEAFDVPGKLTRSQWEDQRKTRLGSPAYIGISIVYDSFEIIDADEARVTFKQTYKSDSYNDVTQKFLLLNKHDDQWLISAEGSQ